jgi:hypothetical protein
MKRGFFMRTIYELMCMYKDVWFEIEDDEKDSFVSQCDTFGFTFHKGNLLTRETCGNRMALHSRDKTVWYVAGMIWYYSFSQASCIISTSDSGGDVIRVNYRAFTCGEPCYIYQSLSELGTQEFFMKKKRIQPGFWKN